MEKSDQEIVDDTDNVAELLFKLDIEMWHAVRSQGKQGELLAVVEDHQTLKTAWISPTMFIWFWSIGRLNKRDCVRSEEEEPTDRHERALSAKWSRNYDNMTTN